MLRAEIAGAAAADPPDLVVAFGSGMARFALEPPLKGIPLVLDMVDVDSEKWAALANTSPMWRRWIYRREASTLSVFEAAAATTARVTFVVNEREADALRRIAPHAAIEVVPNGVDVDAFRPSGPPAEAPMVVFCGVMNYQPNEDGVLWFVREVWPKVRAAEPRATFTIVGSGPGPSIRALAADDSITVTGRVDRVQPYLWRAAVAVAPLRIARGIQNKVLEAIGAGVPVVVTPAVMAGVPDAARDACVEAADSDAFSQGIVNLFHTAPHDRRRRAERAHLESLRWPNQLRQLEALLQRAWTVPGSSR
jgi:sugar transferase (PEP-CTERM/EpsH1 system associated)